MVLKILLAILIAYVVVKVLKGIKLAFLYIAYKLHDKHEGKIILEKHKEYVKRYEERERQQKERINQA